MRKIAGVCGGIADRMGWYPTITRIGAGDLRSSPVSFIIPVYFVVLAITPTSPTPA